jgi:hypothetical protein
VVIPNFRWDEKGRLESQDGRHRSGVAEKLGMSEIPVLLLYFDNLPSEIKPFVIRTIKQIRG